MNQTLDPQIVALTKAIRQVESGGNFGARGGSGEVGGYQYTPDTWAGVAPKYGINVSLEQATPQQQNEVTYKRIKEWKDNGYNVGQIASMWNAGEGRPNAYKENWRGVNKHGVVYDTPAYAKKVATAYQSFKPQTAQAAGPTQTTPEPQKEPFSFSKAAKEIVSPVTTMLARPFQAAQLGAEMVRQSRQNPELEAKAKEYNDQAYQIFTQIKSMPEGPERDKLQAEAERLTNLGKYYSDRLSQNASYQPFSTETLVKEAPQNFADVKKDVGRGIQTVAFGMGPVSGGAAFGAGMSLEEGNDLLSFDTALYTLFGAGAGKALDLVGKPILDASGKVIGKVTPQTLKNVAAGGAKSVQAFMEHNKLLPDAVSKTINAGADVLERGANAPFKAAGSVVSKSDDQIVKARETTLKDLEEKYAQLRQNAARNPEATAATRGRVARSNVLTEDNMINEDGVIIGAKDAAKAYREENIGQGESLVRQLIQKEGVEVDIALVERELKKVMKESFNGRELITAMNAVKREMAGLNATHKGGRISLVDVHDAKVARQPGSKAYESSESKAIDKQIARAHKQVVEKNSKENVKEINAEIGKYLGDAEYIESLQGKRIGSGKLGKAVSQTVGAVTGAAAGGAIGGLPGVAVGSYVGGSVSRRLAGRSLRKALGKPTSITPPKNAIFESGRNRLEAPPLQLPEKASQKAIQMPQRTTSTLDAAERANPKIKPPQGSAKKASELPPRNKKTGKFVKKPTESKEAKKITKDFSLKVGKDVDEKELAKAIETAKEAIEVSKRIVKKEYQQNIVIYKNKKGELRVVDEDSFKGIKDTKGALMPKQAKPIEGEMVAIVKTDGEILRTSDRKVLPKPKAKSLPESSTNNKLDLRNNPQAGFINFGAMFGGGKKTMKPAQLVSHEGAPDKLRVKFWKRMIKEGRKVKPLLVIKEGNKFGIEDGKHRFQAYKELGIKDIPVQIVG